MNIGGREFNQLGNSTQGINESLMIKKGQMPQQVNKRSISGASNKGQFNFNAIKS
jgi:hypothetical protein